MRLAQHSNRTVKRIESLALALLRPGAQAQRNVRELENWVHRELLMADGLTIHATPDATTGERGCAVAPGIDNFRRAKAEAVRQFERDYVLAVMRQAGGNVTRAAQMAGKERRAFGKLIKKHGIDRRVLAD